MIPLILFLVAGSLGYAAVKKSQVAKAQMTVTVGNQGSTINNPDFHPTSNMVRTQLIESSGQIEGGPSIYNPLRRPNFVSPGVAGSGAPPGSLGRAGGGGGAGGAGGGLGAGGGRLIL